MPQWDESALTVTEWGAENTGCWTSCMPVYPHHAHVNSRRFTGCVMSLFTTRGQWMESGRMLSKQCFPLCEGKTRSVRVCVCVLTSLCISPCSGEREGEGMWERVKVSKWARENICVCEHSTCLRGIFRIVFLFCFFALFPPNILCRVSFPVRQCNGLSCISQSCTLL